MSEPAPRTSNHCSSSVTGQLLVTRSVAPRSSLPLFLTLAFIPLVTSEPGHASTPQDARSDSKSYDALMKPFLSKYCFECHGVEKPKGDLRLDQLPADF